jgi:hypothetical protein
MSSYQITVSRGGKFLFRTDRQPGNRTDRLTSLAIEEISSRFPAAEGFKVQLIEFPTEYGDMTDVTK